MTNPSGEKQANAADTLSWWVPLMGEREKELLCEVIDRNFPNDGEYTTAFENQIAAICEVPHAIAITSCTAATSLALMAAGIGQGDEVIVPDITFIATANAVSMTGATPIIADVRQDDFMLDPSALEKKITPRTRAIIPVHVSGRSAPINDLLSLAEHYNLLIIEDSAEGLGSRHAGKPLGSFGMMGTFSFSPAKTITTGQGGMVVTSSDEMATRLRMLKDQGRPLRGTGGADTHLTLGYNFKFTNLQAAMGLAQLEDFPARMAHQRDLYRWYRQHMPESEGLRLLPFDLAGGECPQWIDVWVDDRDALYDFLIEKNIQPRKFWFPLHSQTPYRQPERAFPNGTAVGEHAMWLPSSLTMREEDVKLVCAVIAEWLNL